MKDLAKAIEESKELKDSKAILSCTK